MQKDQQYAAISVRTRLERKQEYLIHIHWAPMKAGMSETAAVTTLKSLMSNKCRLFEFIGAFKTSTASAMHVKMGEMPL